MSRGVNTLPDLPPGLDTPDWHPGTQPTLLWSRSQGPCFCGACRKEHGRRGGPVEVWHSGSASAVFGVFQRTAPSGRP